MKRAYAVSQYGKCYEQYCKEYLPQQAKEIFDKAEQHYWSPALYTISDCWYFNTCITEKVSCLIVCKKTDICYT
mgnify:CR=1 FL=1